MYSTGTPSPIDITVPTPDTPQISFWLTGIEPGGKAPPINALSPALIPHAYILMIRWPATGFSGWGTSCNFTVLPFNINDFIIFLFKFFVNYIIYHFKFKTG